MTPAETKVMICRVIRAELRAREESQSAFAKRWGKSRQYVSRILNDKTAPNFTLETIGEAAALLGRNLSVTIT